MAYKENRIELDISSAGRGLQQTLLLLTHLYANPHTVLLLDEPDAHLEVLRQRQTYQLLTRLADQVGSQIIAASHSEIVLNEAADRDMVVAFIGKPHRIDGRGSQLLKSLTEIGFDQYCQAEQRGWVLYLEGSSDLANLVSLSRKLGHPAAEYLESPFVHYICNQPGKARDHFHGLHEAYPDLVGIAIFDRTATPLRTASGLTEVMWRRKELENYFCMEEVLLSYARHDMSDDLFGQAEADRREQAMRETISEISSALKKLKKMDPWSVDIKATDDFLDPLFDGYFEKLSIPNLMRKSNYHVLAQLVPKEKIDAEVSEKLDMIVSVAKTAKPK